jgi:hypothetical protein
MREPRPGQGQGPYYLVLNRSYADLYEEIAEAFEDRRYIKVIVDRRQGRNGMARIPARQRRLARTRRGQTNPRLLSFRLRKEAS